MYFRFCRPLSVALAVPLLLAGCAEPAPVSSADSSEPATQDPTATPAAPDNALDGASVVESSATFDEPAPTPAAAPETGTEPAAAAAAPADDTVPFKPADLAEPVKPLMLGDAAPPISIAAWVMGNPVESFSKDKVYVVEFWATWCGPCRTSMPHMSSLQEEYGDKVQFIGVTDEDMQTVNGFMEQPGNGDQKWSEIIKYAIALDKSGATSDAYMRAANQNGIPTAFVVGKTGRVEWIGHPMGMDDPLKQIVDGTWDVDAAREKFLAEAREEEDMMKVLPSLQQAMRSGTYPEAVKIMQSLLEKHPSSERIQMILLQVLLQSGMKEELNKHAASVIKNYNDSAQHLNQIAWMMATLEEEKGAADLDMALQAANRAAELTDNKDSSVLDTIARVHYSKGDLKQAIEWQKKAIAAGPGEGNLVQTLEEYEAEAKAADSPKPPEEATPAEPTEEKPAEEKPTEEKPETPAP